jgi:hypothetical protein
MIVDFQIYSGGAWRELDTFPPDEYAVPFDFQYFALGTFEGGKMPISGTFTVPYSDHNATYLGVSDPKLVPSVFKARILLDGATIYEGQLEVIRTLLNGVKQRVEVRFVDKVKEFIDDLKKSKVSDILNAGEGDHFFTVFPDNDPLYGQGMEGLNDPSAMLRYLYQDYTGLENVVVQHRHGEPLGNGDGIQQLQLGFKVPELLKRLFTTDFGNGTRSYESNFIDDESVTKLPTSKIYVQFPMRFHGFDLNARQTTVKTRNRHRPGICGFKEMLFTGDEDSDYTDYVNDDVHTDRTCKFHNWRVTNLLFCDGQVDNVTGTPFFPFMDGGYNDAIEHGFMWTESDGGKYGTTSGLIVQRSGKYKATIQHTFPGMTLFAEKTLQAIATPPDWHGRVETRDISLASGSFTLNLAVSVNGAYPTLFPLKTWQYTDFSDDGDGVKVGSFDVDNSQDDVYFSASQGDSVMLSYIVTSNDGLVNISGIANPKEWGDLVEVGNSGYSMHYVLRDTTTTFELDNAGVVKYLATAFPPQEVDVNIKAYEKYPVSPLPRQYTNKSGVKTVDWEEVDFAKNCDEFISQSLYDILKSLMSRFNLQLLYDLDSNTFTLDNTYEEHVKGAVVIDVSDRYDDEEEIEYSYELASIKSISMMNAEGKSESDLNKLDIPIGSFEGFVINESGEGDVSFSDFMTLANGRCYGEVQNQVLDSDIRKAARYKIYTPRKELNVSEYGIRIGFVNEADYPQTIYYPSMSTKKTPNVPLYHLPQMPKDRIMYPKYFPYANTAEKFPRFELETSVVGGAKSFYTMEWAVPVNGEPTPNPGEVGRATIYEVMWEDYVNRLYGKPTAIMSFLAGVDYAMNMSVKTKYNYGDGEVMLFGLSGLDALEAESVGKIKFLIL